jgi:non-heme chloroperoxidase
MSRLDVTASKSVYYEHYRGDGPAVVLVHGWGMGVRVWDITLPALLDAGHEVVALDHRCCGRSDKDFDEVSTSDIASDVVKLINETDVSEPIVVGWSFGAAVVAEVAITLGSALGGIVLVGPPTPRYTQADGFPHGGTAEIMQQTITALRDTRPEFLHALAEGVCHQDVGRPTIEWMWQMFMETSPRADASLEHLGVIDHRSELPTVEVPALVCRGDHDVVVDPAIGERAAELLPNSRLVKFSDSGHAPFLEEPEKFNAELLAFAADPRAAVAAV